MKVQHAKKRHLVTSGVKHETSVGMTFSSDLLTPEEERELLTNFWDCKSELVRTLIRHFPKLRAHRPAMEPWPMANFVRDHAEKPEYRSATAVQRLYDRYVHYKHRLASANIRFGSNGRRGSAGMPMIHPSPRRRLRRQPRYPLVHGPEALRHCLATVLPNRCPTREDYCGNRGAVNREATKGRSSGKPPQRSGPQCLSL